MGERLNIEIHKNGKALANCYYHWSGYSKESVELAKNIIKNTEIIKCNNDILTAIRLLEATGAGLTSDEIKYAKSIKNLSNESFKETEGRDAGLIGISDNDINETRKWQEHALYIFLDEQRMSYQVFFKQDRWSWKKDNEGAKEKTKFNNLEVVDCICDAIKSHMGKWNTRPDTDIILPVPVNGLEKLVHLCDYLASRKNIEYKFDIEDSEDT